MKRILFVEDDRDICDLFMDMTEHLISGSDVRVAHSVYEARRIITEFDPQIVVTDIVMPGVHGTSLLEHIKMERQDIATCVLTGADTLDEGGIHGHIPWDRIREMTDLFETKPHGLKNVITWAALQQANCGR